MTKFKQLIPIVLWSIIYTFPLHGSAPSESSMGVIPPPIIEIVPLFTDQLTVTAKSLQGLQNRSDTHMIWLNEKSPIDWPNIYHQTYGYQIHRAINDNTPMGLIKLLEKYRKVYQGYILYDVQTNPISMYVALSLTGILDSIALDISLEAKITHQLSIPQRLNVCEHNEAWLWEHYANQFNKSGMCLPTKPKLAHSADYAIQNRWTIIPSQNRHWCESFLQELSPNATLVGWVPLYMPGVGEDIMISYYSRYDAKLLPGVNLSHNFSVKSKIHDYRSGKKQAIRYRQNKSQPTHPFDPNKHYITLFCNSGGNYAYLHKRYLADTNNRYNSDNWMNIPHTVPLTLSMTPLASELSAAALAEIYRLKAPQDSFATSYSGHAYIHPSQYPSLDLFAQQMHMYMARCDQTCVAVHESDNFIDQAWVDHIGARFLASDQVQGLYCQRGPFGKIYAAPQNKPVITRRFGMNIGGNPQKMNQFLDSVNALKPSPYTEAGYSVIQVNLEKTTIPDCQYLYEHAADHISFVTLEDLFSHIKTHVLEN